MRVWTRAYRPFLLGGNVNADIAIEVEPEESVEIDGYTVHRLTSPDGTKTVWADEVSGGLVGGDLEEIKRDIAVAETAFLDKQLQEMKARGEKAESVDAEDFWRQIK